ncbi:MAG TPA: Crp/Fnr family transcriptional regulator [Kiloniellales bacterium]|nr:Crp/Fnr family transcriptional regulator [Kiloniellales bacterium]
MTADPRLAILGRHALFAGLAPRVLEELLAQAVARDLAQGEVLFRAGQPGGQLYAVLEGRVRIFLEGAGGAEITLNLLGAGEVFGEIAMLDGGERTASAAALEPSRLLQLRRESVLAALRRHAELAERIILLLCRRLRWTSEQVEDSAFLPLAARLAKRLLALTDDGASRLRLSQRDLAALVGASREAVNKLLVQWRVDGVIRQRRQELTVVDAEALRKVLEESA